MSDGDTVVGMGDEFVTAGLLTAIWGLGGWLAAVAEPSGAGAAVILYGMPASVLNIRSWFPLQEADTKWTDLATGFGGLAGEFEKLEGEVDSYWKGDGATAFKNFISTKVVSPLKELKFAAENVSTGCNSVAEAMISNFEAWVVAIGVAIVACAAANSATFGSPALKWVAVGTWIGFLSALITGFVTLGNSMRAANDSISTALVDIGTGFKIVGDHVSADDAKLDSSLRSSVTNPNEWNKTSSAPGK